MRAAQLSSVKYCRFILFVLCAGYTQTAVTGDLRNIEPQAVPGSAQPFKPTTQKENELQANIDPDKPLGVSLSGLAFLSSPDQVSVRGLVFEDGVAGDELLITAVPLPTLQDVSFRERLKPYFNTTLTMGVLEKIKREVIDFYTSVGRSYVAVTVPPQDISTGIVQVVVIEGRVGKISVKGNKYFKEDQYLSTLRLKIDEGINTKVLEEDIAWINRNPFRNADVVTEAGKEFGTTDITVVTNERFPLRIYGGYDNHGTDVSGKDRFLAGFNWGNALGLGHELNYQHSRSIESNLSKGHSGSYVIPLPWRHILSFSGAYSKSNPDIAQPFNSEGISWSVDIAYTIPLESIANYSHEFSARIPFKSSDNTLEFSQIPITDNETHVLQAELTYAGSWLNEGSVYGFNINFVGSPGGLTHRNEDRFFNISRAGASSDYAILRAGFTYQRMLPKGFSWNTVLNTQIASGNLLGSEQLGLAGFSAVRGYDNGFIYKDRGLLVRNELRAPVISPLKKYLTNISLPNDSLSVYAFVDAGFGSNVDPLPLEDDNVTMVSTGLGLRYSVGPLLSANLEYGWQLSDDPISVRDTSSQFHASVTIGY